MGVLFQRFSQSVGQQVAGAHLKNKLLLYGPVAQLVEAGAENQLGIFRGHSDEWYFIIPKDKNKNLI